MVTTRAVSWLGRLIAPLAYLTKPMFQKSLLGDLNSMEAALAGKPLTPS